MTDSKQSLILLNIITPDGIVFSNAVRCFETYIANGAVSILSGHSKLISYIRKKPSTIIYENDTREQCLINDGILCVNQDKIQVFTDMFIFEKSLKRHEIQTNYKELRKKLDKTDVGYRRMKLEAMLEFELQKLKWLDNN